jgi:hypothetical protein
VAITEGSVNRGPKSVEVGSGIASAGRGGTDSCQGYRECSDDGHENSYRDFGEDPDQDADKVGSCDALQRFGHATIVHPFLCQFTLTRWFANTTADATYITGYGSVRKSRSYSARRTRHLQRWDSTRTSSSSSGRVADTDKGKLLAIFPTAGKVGVARRPRLSARCRRLPQKPFPTICDEQFTSQISSRHACHPVA